ncbi:molybdopterin molybdotransferase MoeA [Infirmifilum uzonense]|uniref:molybdopterin molybdotransferase MoeA n=1 Tax=Infirmifilum uzonense TaxID=1550241 RepID=UPI003C730F7D
MSLRELHSVAKVIKEALPLLRPPPEVAIGVEQSLGRYSAESVYSTFRLPPRGKSVVDGYAVRAVDVEAASPSAPVPLDLRPELLRPLGGVDFVLQPGQAVRIETGALLPEGADAVIPVEDAFEDKGKVFILKRVAPYENVSLPGEEYDAGLPIIKRGEIVTPPAIAALILEGREHLRVFEATARILNVGDEIVSGSFFRPFTHMFVKAWLEQHGFKVLEVDFSRDEEGDILEWLKRGESYLNIMLGGTSMGGHDFTVRALEKMRPEYMVHGFAVQPGKTACLAIKDGRPFIAMSGLPVAALSTLEVVLKPLFRAAGLRLPEYPVVKARLTRRVTVKMGVIGFARVRVYKCGEELCAEPVMLGGSGSLASLIRGNGFLIVPEGVEGYEEGEIVKVHLYKGVDE